MQQFGAARETTGYRLLKIPGGVLPRRARRAGRLDTRRPHGPKLDQVSRVSADQRTTLRLHELYNIALCHIFLAANPPYRCRHQLRSLIFASKARSNICPVGLIILISNHSVCRAGSRPYTRSPGDLRCAILYDAYGVTDINPVHLLVQATRRKQIYSSSIQSFLTAIVVDLCVGAYIPLSPRRKRCTKLTRDVHLQPPHSGQGVMYTPPSGFKGAQDSFSIDKCNLSS